MPWPARRPKGRAVNRSLNFQILSSVLPGKQTIKLTLEIEALLIEHEGSAIAEHLHRVRTGGCGIAIYGGCSAALEMILLILARLFLP